MFIYCHTCDWGQDDFWNPNGYNPFKKDTIEWLNRILLDGISGKEKYLNFDHGFIMDHPDIKYKEDGEGFYLIDYRDFLAMELGKMSRCIEGMKWVTYEDYKNEKPENQTCPQCGSFDLDID